MIEEKISRKELLKYAIRGIDAEIVDSAKKLDSNYSEYGHEGIVITKLSCIRSAIGDELRELDDQ